MTTSPNHIRRSHRLITIFAIGFSAALIVMQLFRWPITGLILPFFELPLELALGLALLVVTLMAIIHSIRRWKILGIQSLIPASICLVAIALVLWVPFDSLYLDANFHLLRHRRTTAAMSLLHGPEGTAQNRGGRGNLVTLPPKDSLLSSDGVVLVDHRDGKVFVLFMTYRGILDRFSGFVYSSTDDPPAKDQFMGDGIEIERLAPHWFWYSS